MLKLVIFKRIYDGSYSNHELQYGEGWALVQIQVGLPNNWCLTWSDATAVLQQVTHAPLLTSSTYRPLKITAIINRNPSDR